MSETESYPKAEFFRKPNLSEYVPNVPNVAQCFEVWIELTT